MRTMFGVVPAIVVGTGVCLSSAACGGDAVRSTDGGGETSGDGQVDSPSSDGAMSTGSSGSDASGTTLSSTTTSGEDACAHAEVEVTRTPPTVWLLVDRGMRNGNVQQNVYAMVREEMLGPGGIVPEQQSSVRFGLALAGALVDASDCPNLVTVEPALDNLQALETSYPPASTMGVNRLVYYPLDYALQQVRQIDDPAIRRTHATVVFVSEIAESVCMSELSAIGWPVRTAEEANDGIVTELADLGVRSYVLSSNDRGEISGSTVARLERMAELGGSGYGPFFVGNADALGEALRDITASLVSCEVSLEGEVTEGRECTGEVSIDGEPIPCDDPNGWRLTGPSSLEFQGKACEQLRSAPSSQIRARFPCDVIII